MTIFCCQETKSCFSWAEYASLERQRSSRPENMDIVLGSVEGASSRLEHTFLSVVMMRATMADPSVTPDTCSSDVMGHLSTPSSSLRSRLRSPLCSSTSRSISARIRGLSRNRVTEAAIFLRAPFVTPIFSNCCSLRASSSR